MIFTLTTLSGAYLIDLEKQVDERGFFARYFCEKEFAKLGLSTHWVQMNTSLSKEKGTLRGLHFQKPPKAEDKIVRCFRGAIWDVIVDLRKNSKTFGQWYGTELNDINRTMIYVPKGFAHGFQTLTNESELLYLHSEFYSTEHEAGILATDTDLAIAWPEAITQTSDRDLSFPPISQINALKL